MDESNINTRDHKICACASITSGCEWSDAEHGTLLALHQITMNINEYRHDSTLNFVSFWHGLLLALYADTKYFRGISWISVYTNKFTRLLKLGAKFRWLSLDTASSPLDTSKIFNVWNRVAENELWLKCQAWGGGTVIGQRASMRVPSRYAPSRNLDDELIFRLGW